MSLAGFHFGNFLGVQFRQSKRKHLISSYGEMLVHWSTTDLKLKCLVVAISSSKSEFFIISLL